MITWKASRLSWENVDLNSPAHDPHSRRSSKPVSGSRQDAYRICVKSNIDDAVANFDRIGLDRSYCREAQCLSVANIELCTVFRATDLMSDQSPGMQRFGHMRTAVLNGEYLVACGTAQQDVGLTDLTTRDASRANLIERDRLFESLI
jgi:hypothetical protein